MRRFILFAATSVALAMAPSIANADPGPPGSTFPESPGTNLTNACSAVAAAPATGGGTSNNPRSFGIISGLLVDACAGG